MDLDLPAMNCYIHVKLFPLSLDSPPICFVKEEEDFSLNQMIQLLNFNSEIDISICNVCRNSLSAAVPSKDLQAEWRRLTPKLLYPLVARWKLLSYCLLLGQEDFIYTDRGYWIIDLTKFVAQQRLGSFGSQRRKTDLTDHAILLTSGSAQSFLRAAAMC